MTKRQHHRWGELSNKKRRGTINDAERIELANLVAKLSEAAVANITGEHCHGKLKQIRSACK